MNRIAWIVGIAAVVVSLSGPLAASADEYRPEDAGHPVRIAAYVLHPVGWLLDRLIFFPAWWLGQKEPFRTIFGAEAVRADDGPPPAPDEAPAPAVP
ncbi:MAG: hypothetical protein HRU00_06610 [Myxococcales bacterium]|nr:hypothetical protein [Myxococcales bacterium]